MFIDLTNQCFSLLQVLQKQMDLELELFGDIKDKSSTNENKPGENKPLNASAAVAIGRVFMLSLSSQPVDHEDVSGRTKVTSDLAAHFHSQRRFLTPGVVQ